MVVLWEWECSCSIQPLWWYKRDSACQPPVTSAAMNAWSLCYALALSKSVSLGRSSLHPFISSKPKGPGEEGAAGYCPKILLPKKAKRVLCSSIGVIGKSALEMGPFLSRPLCFTAEFPSNMSITPLELPVARFSTNGNIHSACTLVLLEIGCGSLDDRCEFLFAVLLILLPRMHKPCKQVALPIPSVPKRVRAHPGDTTPPPPPTKQNYENSSPRTILCICWGRLRQNYVITKEFIPQELFCAIGGCRDLRLFHVELREIYVTLEEIILRESVCFCATGADVSPPSQMIMGDPSTCCLNLRNFWLLVLYSPADLVIRRSSTNTALCSLRLSCMLLTQSWRTTAAHSAAAPILPPPWPCGKDPGYRSRHRR